MSQNSPAIDAGTNAFNSWSGSDNTGKSRPLDGNSDGNAVIDIGPYESGASTSNIPSQNPPNNNVPPVVIPDVLPNVPATVNPNDTTAPVISLVNIDSVTSNSATISWFTDEPSYGQIEYGNTSFYGRTTSISSAITTAHRYTVTDLVPNSDYAFRARATDAKGNVGVSIDTKFKTTGTGAAPISVSPVSPVSNNFFTSKPATSRSATKAPITIKPTRITSNLSQGSRGEEVKLLQEFLKSQGYNVEVNSVFGPSTQDALIAYQKTKSSTGIRATGILDNATIVLVNSDIASGKTSEPEAVTVGSTVLNPEWYSAIGKIFVDKLSGGINRFIELIPSYLYLPNKNYEELSYLTL